MVLTQKRNFFSCDVILADVRHDEKTASVLSYVTETTNGTSGTKDT